VLDAAIENNGTGYELAITVERTDLSLEEQVVPITLTDANGDAIEGLPTSFMLRIAPGAGATTGVVPLPADVFDPGRVVDATAIGIHRVDATVETEIVALLNPSTQPTGATEWDPSVPVGPGDFQGTLPENSPHIAVIHGGIAIDISPTYSPPVSKDGGWTVDGNSDVRFKPTIDRSKSGIDPVLLEPGNKEELERILRHEQVHMNIWKKFSDAFNDLIENIRVTGTGTTADEARRDAEAKMQAERDRLLQQAFEAAAAKQGQYDEETQHGTDPEMQGHWERAYPRS
jgi:hypothetical protein